MNSATVFLDRKDSEQVDLLRTQEYAKAQGFSVVLQSLRWRESDNQSYILGAIENGQLLATMRGEIIIDPALLEKKLECPWDFSLQIQFPVLLLSRAATSSERRASGLNLVLRYWFIRLARHYSIPFVLGTFIAGSPREKSLREMGYYFFENALGWQQSTYKSLGAVQVVALDMPAHGEKALSYCEGKARALIERFSLQENYPPFRTVGHL